MVIEIQNLHLDVPLLFKDNKRKQSLNLSNLWLSLAVLFIKHN
jgi:hypothetical protein